MLWDTNFARRRLDLHPLLKVRVKRAAHEMPSMYQKRWGNETYLDEGKF